MSSPEKFDPSDAVLLRYLLGVLPVDEAEPVEEASIVDDDIAARLNAMERDLIDNYIRGEMEGSSLTKFQSWYMSSPLRVQKVEAARAILRATDAVAQDVATDPDAAHPVSTEQEVKATGETDTASSAPVASASPRIASSVAPTLSYGRSTASREPGASGFRKSKGWPLLAFATAALIVIVVVGFLTTRNKQLLNEATAKKDQPSKSAAQLDEQHASATGTSSDKTAPSGALAHGTENVATVTLFLPAPTRGASTMPKADVPAGTGLVVLSLGLGSTGEDSYRVQLMNPTTQKILWRSGILRPGSDGTYVSVAVPGNVLRSQVYLVQLMHDAANGKPELLGTYPFRAEVK